MKKFVMTIMILVSFLAVNCVSAYTNQLPEKEKCDKGTLSIRTASYKEVQPDVADLTIIIQTKDKKSFQEASEQNKEISEKIHSALKTMINTENDDYIKTANFSASPDYVYNKDNKPTIKGYTVTNNILVHTRELEKIGKMIDSAIDLGATSIGNLTVSISDYTAVCNELMALASKNAFTQATSVTKNSGSAILGIKTMDVSCTGNSSMAPRQNRISKMESMDMMAESAMPSKSVTIIEHGALRINSNLNAVYYVK